MPDVLIILDPREKICRECATVMLLRNYFLDTECIPYDTVPWGKPRKWGDTMLLKEYGTDALPLLLIDFDELPDRLVQYVHNHRPTDAWFVVGDKNIREYFNAKYDVDLPEMD